MQAAGAWHAEHRDKVLVRRRGNNPDEGIATIAGSRANKQQSSNKDGTSIIAMSSGDMEIANAKRALVQPKGPQRGAEPTDKLAQGKAQQGSFTQQGSLRSCPREYGIH